MKKEKFIKKLERDILLLQNAVNTSTNDWKEDVKRFVARYTKFEKDSKNINKADDYSCYLIQQGNQLNEKFWRYMCV